MLFCPNVHSIKTHGHSRQIVTEGGCRAQLNVGMWEIYNNGFVIQALLINP